MGEWWTWALVSPDGAAPSRMDSVSASVNLQVQKFSSGIASPARSWKKGHKTAAVVVSYPGNECTDYYTEEKPVI